VLHRVGIVVLLLSLLTSSLKFSPHFHSITLSTTLPQRDLLTSSLRLKKLSSSTYIRDSVIMTFLESENLHPKPYVSTITINSDSISKTLNPYGNLKINIHKIHQPNPPSKKTPGLRFDHIVGNVYDMRSTISKMEEIWPSKLGSLTNFAEFTADEVGTPNSGLNSIVLNPLNSSILLPLNEGVDGLLKSQINTYLDFNKGEGVQHVALRCESVIEEVEVMKERGIEFLEAPVSEYYDIVKPKVSEWLNPGEFESCKKTRNITRRRNLLNRYRSPNANIHEAFFEL